MKQEYNQLIADIRVGITVYKSCKKIGIQHVDILSYMKRHPELLSRYQCEVVQAQVLRVQAKQAKIDNSKPGTVTPELFDIILHAVSHGMTYIEAREKYGLTVAVLTDYKNATAYSDEVGHPNQSKSATL